MAKKHKFHKGIAALAIMALVTPLSACSTPASGTTQLTWYINPDGGGSDPHGGGQAELARICSEASGGRYTINVELTPNSATDQRQQLLRRFAGHDSSLDLVSMDPPYIPEFAQAGYLAPIPDDLVDEFTQDRVESSITAATWDGKLVAIPFWANTQLLWYRKSVAQAAGLDMDSGVTWEQLIAAAKQQDVTIGVQASRYEGYTVWINALIAGAGGQILTNPGPDIDDIELGLDSAAGQSAAEIIGSIARDGLGGPSMGVSDETVALNLFQDPKTSGFLVNWPYVWAAFPANGVDFIDDIGWAMYPATDDEGEPAPPFGGISIAVGAYSEHPDLAFEAAQCITSEENQTLYMLGTGNPASRASVFSKPEILEQFPMAEMIRDSLERAVPRPQTQYYGDLSAALQRVWSPPSGVDSNTPKESADLIMAVLRGERLL